MLRRLCSTFGWSMPGILNCAFRCEVPSAERAGVPERGFLCEVPSGPRGREPVRYLRPRGRGRWTFGTARAGGRGAAGGSLGPMPKKGRRDGAPPRPQLLGSFLPRMKRPTTIEAIKIQSIGFLLLAEVVQEILHGTFVEFPTIHRMANLGRCGWSHRRVLRSLWLIQATRPFGKPSCQRRRPLSPRGQIARFISISLLTEHPVPKASGLPQRP